MPSIQTTTDALAKCSRDNVSKEWLMEYLLSTALSMDESNDVAGATKYANDAVNLAKDMTKAVQVLSAHESGPHIVRAYG